MTNIEDVIVERFQAQDGLWIVDAGKTVEAGLLKQAVARISDLKMDLEDAEALAADWEDHFDSSLEEAFADYTEQRDQFAEAYHQVIAHVIGLKQASASFVERCDNFLHEEGSDE